MRPEYRLSFPTLQRRAARSWCETVLHLKNKPVAMIPNVLLSCKFRTLINGNITSLYIIFYSGKEEKKHGYGVSILLVRILSLRFFQHCFATACKSLRHGDNSYISLLIFRINSTEISSGSPCKTIFSNKNTRANFNIMLHKPFIISIIKFISSFSVTDLIPLYPNNNETQLFAWLVFRHPCSIQKINKWLKKLIIKLLHLYVVRKYNNYSSCYSFYEVLVT